MILVTLSSSDLIILFSVQNHLNNVRREATRQLRYEKKEYRRAEIEERETNSEIKNIRDSYRASMILRRASNLELIQ
jgi:hypothetical protein